MHTPERMAAKAARKPASNLFRTASAPCPAAVLPALPGKASAAARVANRAAALFLVALLALAMALAISVAATAATPSRAFAAKGADAAKADTTLTTSGNAKENAPADYSAVDAAKKKVPKDLTLYTPASVDKLNRALAAVKTGLTAKDQAKVDAWAQDIEDAVDDLVRRAIFNDRSIVDAAFNLPATAVCGIDVSQWNGTIDWDAAKAGGVAFAIIRCGYGADEESQDDRMWLRNVQECERVGIPYGVYLYSYAQDVEDAEDEAAHALRALRAAGAHPTLPVYYDLEEPRMGKASNVKLLGDMADAFCTRVSAAGYQAGVYANLNWWNNYLTDSRFAQWDRWVAQWNTRCTYAGNYRLWQYSSIGEVPGCTGSVDLNWLFSFADVPLGHWFNTGGWLDKAVRTGVVSGYKDAQGRPTGLFKPDQGISRGELVTVLYRIANPESTATTDAAAYEANSTPFTDCASGAYYSAAMNWAYATGVVQGYQDYAGNPLNLARPDAAITRQELATMLYRYALAQGASADDVPDRTYLEASDAADVSTWARPAAEWCYDHRVMSGSVSGGVVLLKPLANATRAEATKMVLAALL